MNRLRWKRKSNEISKSASTTCSVNSWNFTIIWKLTFPFRQTGCISIKNYLNHKIYDEVYVHAILLLFQFSTLKIILQNEETIFVNMESIISIYRYFLKTMLLPVISIPRNTVKSICNKFVRVDFHDRI